MNQLSNLPSVDQLLQQNEIKHLIASYGREFVVDAVRFVLNEFRKNYFDNPDNHKNVSTPNLDEFLVAVSEQIEAWLMPTLVPVINATGVILHTNLGRAPLCKDAIEALIQTGQGYSTLEFDLEKGKRGSRSVHAELLLTKLSGAEAALVVNNNAAAVLLVLTVLARRRRVVISRTQLVEIGGGFRLPEVMSQSGALLVEVGTTNRVHLSDYEDALQQPTAVILCAHHSNYRILGFTEETDLIELARLSKQYGTFLVDDLGSGAFLDTTQFGLGHEPTVQEALEAGADLVCFSGDKLLGGPQSGIILGSRELITKIKKHQLARAVRADKLCLAALTATLMCYLKGRAEQEIPVWQMIAAPLVEIEKRANRWRSFLEIGDVVQDFSTVGGGSMPGETILTSVLTLKVEHPDQFLAKLRKAAVPIIARVANDLVLLDPRTVQADQEDTLLQELKGLL